MPKLGDREWDLPSLYSAGFQILFECDLPQRDNHVVLLKEPQFVAQESAAVIKLIGCGPIPWWGAAYGGPNIAICQYQSIIAVRRGCLIGKPVSVQGFIEPVPASITGEHATGSIPSVGSRSKTKHIESSTGIAEAWDGPSPIGPVHKLTPFRPCDGAPVRHQSITGRTVSDGLVENG